MEEDKIHVIDNETGFCKTCNKFEDRNVIEKKYERIGSSKAELLSPAFSKFNKQSPSIPDISSNDSSSKYVNYKRYRNCDICMGKPSQYSKFCQLCETLYYVPCWLFLILTIINCGLIATTVYFSLTYANTTMLSSYAQPCSAIVPCDTSKGLYCRSKNATSLDYCNCPAYSLINFCDCPSNYFWNGLKCQQVYTYGNGPCIADYSCTRNLICDSTSQNCTCPTATPLWNDTLKTCNYNYRGCFTSCYGVTPCEYPTSACLIRGASGSAVTYDIELSTCTMLCTQLSSQFVIMNMNTNIYRCCCTNKTIISTQLADFNCNAPCSISDSISRCPRTTGKQSVFQLY